MPIRFIKNIVGVKTDQAVEGFLQAIVAFDPKSATEAELRTMEQNLDDLGRQLAEAEMVHEKEEREAQEIQKLYNQRMAAAERLSEQMEKEEDPTQRGQIEKSLNTLLTMLEEMAPDIDAEREEAQSAKEFVVMLKEAFSTAGQKLKTARRELEAAQRDQARALRQKELAEQQAEGARQAAGLAGATTGLGTALKAMRDSAAKAERDAKAARMKADMLRPTKPEQDDPILAQALSEARGDDPKPTSAKDRLAALKQRK